MLFFLLRMLSEDWYTWMLQEKQSLSSPQWGPTRRYPPIPGTYQPSSVPNHMEL